MFRERRVFNSRFTKICCCAEAEDPDLDALLADICKLEEDTKKQLKNSGGGGGTGKSDHSR